MRKVAFVGADARAWKRRGISENYLRNILRTLMLEELEKGRFIFVSGGCPYGGVDIIAEEVAKKLGLKCVIYKPKRLGWRWYRERNIKIAEECDVLFCIEPLDRVKSGGIWTLNWAKKLGKEVYLVLVGKGGWEVKTSRRIT